MISGQQNNYRDRIINVEILTADRLVKGIYLTLEEFKQNSPSVITDFRSNEMNLPDNNIYNNMANSRLLVFDQYHNLVPFRQSHWGICDGNNVFISFKGKYYQVSLDGKYSSFTATRGTRNNLSSFGIDYVLNVVTGRIIKISWVSGYRNKYRLKSVKGILSTENPALYKEFMDDSNKKMMVFSYIKMLNDSFEYR
jgi:hypothetical protein